MGLKNYYGLSNGKDNITSEDIQEFCAQLRNAIQETNLDGKTDREIVGEIYTRTRSKIWCRVREESYIRKLFVTNMKTISRNMPDKIQAIANYVISQVLKEEIPVDHWGDVQLSIASMDRLTKKMSDVAGLSESLGNQLMEINRTIKNDMEELYV